jgi:hypothetical protein
MIYLNNMSDKIVKQFIILQDVPYFQNLLFDFYRLNNKIIEFQFHKKNKDLKTYIEIYKEILCFKILCESTFKDNFDKENNSCYLNIDLTKRDLLFLKLKCFIYSHKYIC